MSAITEDEAKQRWCPFGRGMVRAKNREETATGFNRGHDIGTQEEIPLTYCIGSACMAWRWDELGKEVDEPHGYCGLAGKP